MQSPFRAARRNRPLMRQLPKVDNPFVSMATVELERSFAPVCLDISVGAKLEQSLDDLVLVRVGKPNGVPKWSVIDNSGTSRCHGGTQEVHNFVVALLHDNHEWRLAACVDNDTRGSVLEQKATLSVCPFRARHKQGRLTWVLDVP